MSERETERLGVAFVKIFEALTSDLHTALIAQITEVASDKQRISVQPVLKRLYEGEENSTLLPIIEDVPVSHFGFGDFIIVSEPKIGNYVLLICSERSIADWLDQGGIIEPTKQRRFSLSDAIAIVGLFPDSDLLATIPEGISIVKKDLTVRLNVKNNQITATINNMDLEITDGNVKAKPIIPNITDVNVYNPVGPPAPGYVSLNSHTHNVTAVGSPTGPPIPIPGPP